MFKNWPEISKLGASDRFLMLAFCYLDLNSEVATKLKSAFPEFFSESEVRGPIPFSFLKEWMKDHWFTDEEREEATKRWQFEMSHCGLAGGGDPVGDIRRWGINRYMMAERIKRFETEIPQALALPVLIFARHKEVAVNRGIPHTGPLPLVKETLIYEDKKFQVIVNGLFPHGLEYVKRRDYFSIALATPIECLALDQ